MDCLRVELAQLAGGVDEGQVAGPGVEADRLVLGPVTHQSVFGLEVDILASRSVMDYYCSGRAELRATW